MKIKRRQIKRRVEKTGDTIDNVKKLDKFYLIGLQKNCKKQLRKLSMQKNQTYRETKPSHNKYRSLRLSSPMLNVAVNKINDSLFIDLVYVGKSVKCSRDLKYLLVADSLLWIDLSPNLL